MASNFYNYTAQNAQNQSLQQMPQMQQMPTINNQPNINQSLPNFFLQPIGSIYNITTASEINQVPASSNISLGLCLSENIMYIKSFQNGVPLLLGYRLSPIEGAVVSPPAEDKAPAAPQNKTLEERIDKIESSLLKITELLGGDKEWRF